MSIRDNLIRNSKFIGYDRENSISIKSYVGNDNPFTVPCDGIINVMARADLNNRFAVRVFIKDNAESEATYSMGTVVSTPDMQTWGREIFEVFKVIGISLKFI